MGKSGKITKTRLKCGATRAARDVEYRASERRRAAQVSSKTNLTEPSYGRLSVRANTHLYASAPRHGPGGTSIRAHIMGERACQCVAGMSPRALFFPEPADHFLPVYIRGGRRDNNININININTMALSWGPVPPPRAQGLPLTHSGVIPLSLKICTPCMVLGQPFR